MKNFYKYCAPVTVALTLALLLTNIAKAAPSGVRATDGEFGDKIRIDFNGNHGGAGTFRLYANYNGQPVTCSDEFFTGMEKREGSAETGQFDFAATDQAAGHLYNFTVGEVVRFLVFTRLECADGSDVGFKTPPQPPTEPISATTDDPAKIRVVWGASYARLGLGISYEVDRGPSASGPWTWLGTVNNPSSGTVFSYDDTTAISGTTYYYRIRAVSAGGTGASVPSRAVEGRRQAAFNPPTGVTASDRTFTDKVRVTWTPSGSTGVLGYRIYRASAVTGPWTSFLNVVTGASTAQFDDTTATAGTTYYYMVRSYGLNNLRVIYESGNSNTDAGTRGTVPSTVTLPAPSGLIASDGTFLNKVQLTWRRPEGERVGTHYDVERKLASAPSTAWQYLGSSNGNTMDDTSAQAGQVYSYRVFAVATVSGQTAYSVPSNEDNGHLESPVVPPPPTTNECDPLESTGWQEPTANPPAGNKPAPVNVSGNSQIKTGCLGLGLPTGQKPAAKLDVQGNAFFNGVVNITRNLGVDGNIVYKGQLSQSSDARLKTKVQTLTGSLAKILSLRGVSYERRVGGQGPELGVIAQELEPVFPEAVVTDSAGYKSVEYQTLIAPLIEAIKEQQQEIGALRAEVERLKAN